jgi:hypothetical protein
MYDMYNNVICRKCRTYSFKCVYFIPCIRNCNCSKENGNISAESYLCAMVAQNQISDDSAEIILKMVWAKLTYQTAHLSLAKAFFTEWQFL